MVFAVNLYKAKICLKLAINSVNQRNNVLRINNLNTLISWRVYFADVVWLERSSLCQSSNEIRPRSEIVTCLAFVTSPLPVLKVSECMASVRVWTVALVLFTPERYMYKSYMYKYTLYTTHFIHTCIFFVAKQFVKTVWSCTQIFTLGIWVVNRQVNPVMAFCRSSAHALSQATRSFDIQCEFSSSVPFSG